MALPQKKPRYTYADYLAWDENERIELIDGEPVMMAPPLRIHQKISGEIFAQIHNYLEGKKCEVYSAPFGVRLFEEEGDAPENVLTVVEPDITVICDPKKLDKYGCKGAPDMIVEILSPSTASYDMIVKLNQYLKAGVTEFWIVDPAVQRVQVFLLDNGVYQTSAVYTASDIAKVNVLDGCFIELSRVFPNEE